MKKIGSVRAAAATATTAAAATAMAMGGGDFIGRGHAAEFERHGDVAADFLLQPLELFARGDEVAGDVVFKKRFTGGFELADFSRAKLDAGVLLLVQLLAVLVDALELQPCLLVVEEALDGFLELLEQRIVGDVRAQLAGLDDYGGVFGSEGHGRCITVQADAGNGQFAEISAGVYGLDARRAIP